MDKIIIKGLRVFCFHGVNEEEKINGQNFIIDAVMYTDVTVPGKDDNIDNTVSYAKAAKLIKKTMTEKSYDLLEKVATRVAEDLLDNFKALTKVDILLKKPEAPVNLEFDYFAVEISRSREDLYVRSSN